MKKTLISLSLLITGCSTVVPVTTKFPDVPTILLEKCPQLKTIEGDNTTLSEFTKTVTINYTTYYECAIKSDAWIEWYQVQKQLFNSK
jgi:hypothetical protein